MKSTIKRLWLIHFLLLAGSMLFFSSCKKSLFDYRHKYTGRWEFTTYYSSYNWYDTSYNGQTIVYPGEIEYGEKDDELLIKYSDMHSVVISISHDGEISGLPTKYCNGEFDGYDKLDLFLRYGGLGGGSSHDITAVKH